MNTFIAKKLGEVLAFERMGEDTINRGRDAVNRAYGAEEVDKMLNSISILRDNIELIAEGSKEFKSTILDKAEATGKKLESMRSIYLSEEDWNDPVEILEWSGFFEGAAIVHWSLVAGGAEKINTEEASSLAEKGMEHHGKVLERVTEIIQNAEDL